MVNFCAIFNCGNRSGRDKKSFYRLPAENSREGEKTLQLSCERRKKWLAVISRNIKSKSLPYIRVCSDHFISGKPSALYDSTNPDWVPSLKLGHDKISVQGVECDSDRYNRTQARCAKRKHSDAAEALLDLHVDNTDQVPEDQQEEETGTATQTTLEGQSISNMEKEVQRLFEENQKLRNQLATQHNQFDQEFFKDNDDKMVRNYVRTTERASYSSKDIFRAVNACKTKQMSLRQAAKEYKIPKSTLYNKLKQFTDDTGLEVHQDKADRTYDKCYDVSQESAWDLNHWSPEHDSNQGKFVIQQVLQADKVQNVIHSKVILESKVDITDITPRLGRRTVFRVDEEARLERLILEKQTSGTELTRQDVCRLAFYFAESNNIQHTFRRDIEMAGRFWLDGFLSRHPYIELRTGRGMSKDSVRSWFQLCLDDGTCTPSTLIQLGGNQTKRDQERTLQVENFNKPLETACNGGELLIDPLGIVYSPNGPAGSAHCEDMEGWIDDDGDPDLSCDGKNISNAEDHVVKDHQGTQIEGETTDNLTSSRTVELYIKEEATAYSEPAVWNAALSTTQQTTCNRTDFTDDNSVLDGTNKSKINQHLNCGEQSSVTAGHPRNSNEETDQHQQCSDCHIKQKESFVHCSKDSSSNTNLDHHTKTHSANRPFQCPFCHKWYLAKSDLLSHTIKVHSDRNHYECSHCHKFFLNAHHLKKHLLVHTEVKPYECSRCHMSFFTKQHLKRHIALHTGQTPFKCQYCRKRFADKDNLDKHVTVHAGEKLFRCPYCIKSFMTNSKLKRHMMKHPPVKPYKCSYCPKFFATKLYYTRHNLLIHTRERPNACSHCPKFFATKSFLLSHMKAHTDEKTSA